MAGSRVETYFSGLLETINNSSLKKHQKGNSDEPPFQQNSYGRHTRVEGRPLLQLAEQQSLSLTQELSTCAQNPPWQFGKLLRVGDL